MNASRNVSSNVTATVAEAVQQFEQVEEGVEGEPWPCSGSPFLAVCSALDVNAQILRGFLCVLALMVIACVLYPTSCLPTEAVSDDPRKALLQETTSSLRDPSSSKAEGKKKKTSFAEDTSCAPVSDVDEEDL